MSTLGSPYVPVGPNAYTPTAPPAGAFVAPVPADAPGEGSDYNALYAALLGFAWRTIGFPVTEFDTDLRQDIVIHKFADRDGAHVEGTGRAAIQVTAHIPFINGLRAGANETWSRPLYPYTWRQFFSACAESGSGTLVHPELGPLTCKLQSFKTTWSGGARGGPSGIAVWIESDDTGDDLDNALSTPSPLAQVAGAAADLDAAMTSVDPKIVPHLPTFPTTFGDLVNQIKGAIDQVSLLENQYGGQVNSVFYQAQTLEDALNMAGNRSALNWPMFQAAEQMKSAAYDLQQTLLTKGKTVGLYTVQGDQSLSQVASKLSANLADIMTLNTALVQNPIVLDGTVVRYYR